MMLEDSHYQLAIAQSKLASLTNEKDQEIEGLKSKVSLCVCSQIWLWSHKEGLDCTRTE